MRAEITKPGSGTFTFLSLQRPQPVADVRFAAVSVCEVGAVQAGGGHHEVTQYLDSVGNLLGQSSCEGSRVIVSCPPRGNNRGGLKLGFIDFDLVLSSVCPFLLGRRKIRRKWHGKVYKSSIIKYQTTVVAL